MGGRPQFICPHCGETKLRIRSSQKIHPLLKKIWLQCPNPWCGFTCAGNIEITHQISPSGQPNSDIQLQTLAQVKMMREIANYELFDE